MYDVDEVVQYCLENNIQTIQNDLKEPPYTQVEVMDLHEVWKSLLSYKPYDKYSK